MLVKKIFPLIAAAFCVIQLYSCAGQGSPEGGPVDATPPIIIRTEPDSNQVNVVTDKIVLEFSEYVDRRSVEESIFISPPLGELEFDWSGPEVTIAFSDTLRADKTYVINIGTDVIDVRARNRLAEGFTLAFATGNTIDKGMLRGRVYDPKPEGVMVFGYSLSSIRPDTLDPSKVKPDYITQTGKDGIWTLSNLSLNKYRLFAVRDEYRNLLYDRQVDQYGVSTNDFLIDSLHPAISDIRFRLSQEDTAKPFVTRAEPVDNRRVRVYFSEPLDTSSFQRATISILDTIDGKPVEIALRSLDKPDSSMASLVLSAALDSAKGYRLEVKNLIDTIGNAIDTAHAAITFGGTNVPDTLRPLFEVRGMLDSMRSVSVDQQVVLQFSEPVDSVPLRAGIVLEDSNRSGVNLEMRWLSAANLHLVPKPALVPNMRYRLRFTLDSLRDFSGNRFVDSVFARTFWTIDLRSTGTIDGFVLDPDSSLHQGDVVLTASQLFSTPPYTRVQRLKQPGKFHFDRLPEGRYLLDSYRDRDSSNTFTFGKPFPFQPSERFTTFSDTLKVRARWGVEGVNVIYKQSK